MIDVQIVLDELKYYITTFVYGDSVFAISRERPWFMRDFNEITCYPQRELEAREEKV